VFRARNDNLTDGFVLDHWVVNGTVAGNVNQLVFVVCADSSVSAVEVAG
jgi:hypothetical protein